MAAKREKLDAADIYQLSKPKEIQFVPSGCTILDCVLGGGWPVGRISNLVGDRSTAKTALATEAVINFLRKYPSGLSFYRETEAAFDMNYAQQMGMPIDKVDFGNPDEPLLTVEDFSRDLEACIEVATKAKQPAIYVLDSLDALSDEAEMGTDGQAGFGMQKAKLTSILFRKTARKLERTQVLLLVVSQVRENIGVSFGEKYRRSGGKALDFYSSVCLWLAHIKTLKRTISKVERSYGVVIKAKTKKNKVAMPFRDCEFPFIFGYGTDDIIASLEWLKSTGRIDKEQYEGFLKMSDTDYKGTQILLAQEVNEAWSEIEAKFAPQRSKYT